MVQVLADGNMLESEQSARDRVLTPTRSKESRRDENNILVETAQHESSRRSSKLSSEAPNLIGVQSPEDTIPADSDQ